MYVLNTSGWQTLKLNIIMHFVLFFPCYFSYSFLWFVVVLLHSELSIGVRDAVN